MTPFPYSVEVESNIASAHALMAEHHIRHVPVTRDGKVVGVISDRDIKAISVQRRKSSAVSEVASGSPYVVDLSTRLDEVLREMVARQIGSAVVTRKGKLAGIFTTIDACRAFADYLQAQFPPEPPDDVA